MGPRGDQVPLCRFRRKEYIRRKHQGVSNVNEKQHILTRSYQSVPHPPNPGLPHLLQRQFQEIRRSRHVLQWQSLGLSRCFSSYSVVDVFEKTSATEQAFNVSAVKNIHAAARSVFILERYPPIHPGPTPATASRTTACTSASRSESKSTLCLSTNLSTFTASLSHTTNIQRYCMWEVGIEAAGGGLQIAEQCQYSVGPGAP